MPMDSRSATDRLTQSSTAAGLVAETAAVRIACRTSPMMTAASSPCAATSPIEIAMRRSGRLNASNQSPPTSDSLVAGRYAAWNDAPGIVGSRSGSKARCKRSTKRFSRPSERSSERTTRLYPSSRKPKRELPLLVGQRKLAPDALEPLPGGDPDEAAIYSPDGPKYGGPAERERQPRLEHARPYPSTRPRSISRRSRRRKATSQPLL
jgi:hypothetical protein